MEPKQGLFCQGKNCIPLLPPKYIHVYTKKGDKSWIHLIKLNTVYVIRFPVFCLPSEKCEGYIIWENFNLELRYRLDKFLERERQTKG